MKTDDQILLQIQKTISLNYFSTFLQFLGQKKFFLKIWLSHAQTGKGF